MNEGYLIAALMIFMVWVIFVFAVGQSFNGEGGCVQGFLIIVGLLVGHIMGSLIVMSNQITLENAVPRFAEKAGVSPSEIVVVSHSDNNPFTFGNPHEVIFEMKINDEPVLGQCTSKLSGPIICLFLK